MIWSLVREQLRSQRRYTVWTAGVIAVTVGLAVYGVLMAFATASATATVDDSLGGDREWTAYTYLARETQEGDAERGVLSVDEYDAAMDAGLANGSRPLALATMYAYAPVEGVLENGRGVAVGIDGDMAWDDILVDGAAPSGGEVVVSAAYAKEAGVGIGDEVQLAQLGITDDGLADPTAGLQNVGSPLIVSGLARSGATVGPLGIRVPDAWVTLDDALTLNAAAQSAWTFADSGYTIIEADVYIAYDGSMPVFDPTASPTTGALGGFGTDGGAVTVLSIALVGVGALIVGIIAMAFAVGRAQAQARSRWVATARALGAKRSHIVTATMLEAAVVGVVAGVAGLVLGAAAVAAHAFVIQVAQPHSFFEAAIPGNGLVALAAVAFGVFLALIVGAIPAFWSARVAPSAALKPVTELTEAEVSRRVSVRPLVVAWAIATSVAVACTAANVDGLLVAVQAGAVVVMLVLTVVLIQELLRWSVPRAGRRLAQSASRPAMIAGDIITARPRQATIPAFITALASAAMVAIYIGILARNALVWVDGGIVLGSRYTMDVAANFAWPTMGVFAITTLLGIAIAASSAQLTARDAATREALGATRRDGRLGAAIAFSVAQAHGLIVGVATGAAAGLWSALESVSVAEGEAIAWWDGVVAPLALSLGLGCVVIAAGTAVVAALAPTVAPVSKIEAVSL